MEFKNRESKMVGPSPIITSIGTLQNNRNQQYNASFGQHYPSNGRYREYVKEVRKWQESFIKREKEHLQQSIKKISSYANDRSDLINSNDKINQAASHKNKMYTGLAYKSRLDNLKIRSDIDRPDPLDPPSVLVNQKELRHSIMAMTARGNSQYNVISAKSNHYPSKANNFIIPINNRIASIPDHHYNRNTRKTGKRRLSPLLMITGRQRHRNKTTAANRSQDRKKPAHIDTHKDIMAIKSSDESHNQDVNESANLLTEKENHDETVSEANKQSHQEIVDSDIIKDDNDKSTQSVDHEELSVEELNVDDSDGAVKIVIDKVDDISIDDETTHQNNTEIDNNYLQIGSVYPKLRAVFAFAKLVKCEGQISHLVKELTDIVEAVEEHSIN